MTHPPSSDDPKTQAGAPRRPASPRRPTAGGRSPHAHTRWVHTAKVALPVLAAGTLALIAVWPLFTGPADTGRVGPEGGQLEMVDARYMGTDADQRPFEVRAEKAVQVGGETKTVELVKPEAEITLKGGDWVTLSAREGRYDQQSGQLSLSGRVTLFQDSGYEFVTDSAQVDTQRSIAWGNAPIRGQGPVGDIAAGGFRILEDGNTIVFTGKARLRLVDGLGDKRG